jgi:hypothetical protein
MSAPEVSEIVLVASSSEPVAQPPEEPIASQPEKVPQIVEEVQAGAEGGQDGDEEEREEEGEYEEGGEDDDGDCHCRECLMGYAPENWHQEDYYDDREDYDGGGYGCDWNESGYFD